MVRLSIIIVNFNTFDLTCKSIDSVLKYVSEPDFEIILVDNASEEFTADNFLERFPQIHLVKSKINVGFAKGNNLGLEVAKGDFILMLNSDTELTSDCVSPSLKKMEDDENIGALSVKIKYPNGQLQNVTGRFPSLKTEIKELLRMNKKLGPDQRAELFLGSEFDHLSYMEVDWIWGTFFLTRRSVIDTFPNKKLHDYLFMYGEDIQWCYHIKKNGYKIVYDPSHSIVHHLASSEKNKEDLESKNMRVFMPNLSKIIVNEHGRVYAFLFFMTKAFLHFSLRKKKELKKGFSYFRIALISCVKSTH
jgi:GT2 family glycosyltransferase